MLFRSNWTSSAACKGFAKPFQTFKPHTDIMGMAIIGNRLYMTSFLSTTPKSHGGEVVSMSLKGGPLTLPQPAHASLPRRRCSSALWSLLRADRASGRSHRRVQCHGAANERLQRLFINLVALVDIDGAPGVAFEAGVEEA